MPRTLVIIAHPNLTGPAGSRVHSSQWMKYKATAHEADLPDTR